MDLAAFDHIVWCDLELALLKIHSSGPWDTKMISSVPAPDGGDREIVNVFVCDEDDEIFDDPRTYREDMVSRGSYRGHHFGPPARFKVIDGHNLALAHPDPGTIVWSLVVKYVLTVFSLRRGVLHIKGAAVASGGRAHLILGRGGSGKTEMARAMCRQGARLLGNTHLLVDGDSVCGVRSNIRVREGGRDVYLPADRGHGPEADGDWMPIGSVLWVRYRTDGRAVIAPMPPDVAKANLRFFAESVGNWELKEDVADHFGSDPLDFGRSLSAADALLDALCRRFDVRFAQVDVFSQEGAEALVPLLQADSRDRPFTAAGGPGS